FLFLGHAETLRGISQEFHLRHTHETFYYQKKDSTDRTIRPRFEISNASFNPTPLVALQPDATWLGTIQRASERIRTLTTNGTPTSTFRSDAQGTPVHSELRKNSWNLSAALELLKEERFEEALATLHTLPSESMHDPNVLLLRAVLFTHGNDLTKAEKAC